MRDYYEDNTIYQFDNKPLINAMEHGIAGDNKNSRAKNIQMLAQTLGASEDTIKGWCGLRYKKDGHSVVNAPSKLEDLKKLAAALNIDYHNLLTSRNIEFTTSQNIANLQNERDIISKLYQRLSRLIDMAVILDYQTSVVIDGKEISSDEFRENTLREITEELHQSMFYLHKENYDKMYRLIIESIGMLFPFYAPPRWCEISTHLRAAARIGVIHEYQSYIETYVPNKSDIKENLGYWDDDLERQDNEYEKIMEFYDELTGVGGMWQLGDDLDTMNFVQLIISDAFIEVVRHDFADLMI